MFLFLISAQNKVYGTVVDMEHHLVRKDSSGFDFQEFWDHPERYASTFSLKVCKLLLNTAEK